MAKRVDGVDVFLTTHGSEIHAYEDRCAHLGRPLHDGIVRGRTLICRAHGWEYDTVTGDGTNPCGVRLRRFPVRVEQGEIWVDVAAAPTRVRLVDGPAPGEPVGPILVKGELADAVAAAIRDLNDAVELQDRGGYVHGRQDRCRVTREAVERHLGRSVVFPGSSRPACPPFPDGSPPRRWRSRG